MTAGHEVPRPTYWDLIQVIGKLGRIIDYLVAYLNSLKRPKVRAVIHVVRVQHK